MFRQRRRRRLFTQPDILKNYFSSLRKELIAIVIGFVRAIVYLGLNLFYALNFSYQKTKAAIIFICHWAMQYKATQFAVKFVKESAFAIYQFYTFASVQFKTFIVNTVPIRAFVLIARVLPIGDWLKYEEQDSLVGHTSFSYAVRDKDFVLLDRILKVCSQEALYRYLFMKNYIEISPLQYAIFHYKTDTTATKKILKAILPKKRIWVLNNLTCYNSRLIVFSLARGEDVALHCKKVMELLPEKDKIHFMNQVDSQGNSPILLQAMNGQSWEYIKGFLEHYPKQHLFDYLNIKNEKKETFLTEVVQHPDNNYIEKIIEMIPEEQRAAYLAKHSQGMKALLYAKASHNYFYAYCHIATLEKYGIKVPEKYAHLSSKELEEQLPKIFEELDAQQEIDNVVQSVKLYPNEQTVRENFKLKHGVYPLEVLQVDNENVSFNEIKTAYKKLVLFSHPDKNKDSEESTIKTTLINEAYGVYAKSDVRKSYYQTEL